MVAVPPAQQVDVQGEPSVIGKCLEEIVSQVAFEIVDMRGGQIHVIYKIRPPAQVDAHACKRFVHGNVRSSEAHDTGMVAQRLVQRLAEADAYVLGAVVKVDPDVARAGKGAVEEAVLDEERQHVVHESITACNARTAKTVERQVATDVGFFGLSLYQGFPSHNRSFLPLHARERYAAPALKNSFTADSNAPVSSSDPTLTRRQLSSIG